MLRNFIRFVGFSSLAMASVAIAQTQASESQTIKAGIVILENSGIQNPLQFSGYPISAAPYTWYNLQNDRTVKPAAWNIENPNASSLLTPDQQTRWNAIAPTQTPGAGAKIGKQNGPYWEVFLSKMSDAALARYDVLLVNPYRYAVLSPIEREKLRRFVDGGGLLWIDAGQIDAGNTPDGSGVDTVNGFPLAFGLGQGNGPERNFIDQPLLSNPQVLSANEITLLNTSIGSQNRILQPANQDSNLFGGLTAQFAQFQPVTTVGGNGNATMSIAHIGDGIIVVTARGASIKLNKPSGITDYFANREFTAMPPNLDREGRAAAKLAVNMISLLSEYRQQSAGSRKNSSTAVNVGAPLLMRSAFPGTVTGTPTVYKGMVLVNIGGEIIAYDANPANDLDGDGDPDDGIPDYNQGGVEDIVWRTGAIGATTTPIVAHVPGDAGGRDEVVVLTRNGMATINVGPDSNIYNKSSANRGILASNTISGMNNDAKAPTVHEGIAYITSNGNGANSRGKIWLVDLSVGSLPVIAALGDTGGNALNLPPFTQSPTIGYIPIFDNSGGVDKVLYAPFGANAQIGVPSAGFSSIWLGTKGEKPSSVEDTGSGISIQTRAGLPILLPAVGDSPVMRSLAVKLVVIDETNNGKPVSRNRMNQLFGSSTPDPMQAASGVLDFAYAGAARLRDTESVRVDYSIDLGGDANDLAQGVERGRINLPDMSSGPLRTITGPIALAPNGSVFMNAQANISDPKSGLNNGGVFGFREEGRGLFRMILRYEMYKAHTLTLNGGNTQNYAAAFTDRDPLLGMVNSFAGLGFTGNMSGFKLIGSPIVRNDQVLVTAAATEEATSIPVPVPATVVMAFKATPDVSQIQVGQLPEGSTILQYDAARSTSGARDATPIGRLDVQSTFANANYNYNADTGIVRFENLGTVQKGVVQQSFSQSQPLIIRKPGQPDVLLDPNSVAGNRWSPLLWYGVVMGLDITGGATSTTQLSSGPISTGDTLFISGASRTPNLLTGNGFANTGMIYGIRTNVSAGNAYLQPDQSRPWMSQYVQIKSVNFPDIDSNPGYAWPLAKGATSFGEFVVRLNQARLRGFGIEAQTGNGVVAGDGVLMSWGDAGLFTFSKSDFLVADEGRIATFDPAGNITWSSIASASSGVAGNIGIGIVKPLERPTRAYRLPDKSIVTVDPGTSRVAIIDPTGVETRTITDFKLDPTTVPPGYTSNESLSLNGPRDVLVYTSFETPTSIGNRLSPAQGNVPNEFWVHYLIADSGNQRLVEVVDRYKYDFNRGTTVGAVTVNQEAQIGVLLWHSPVNVSGKQYSYSSISRIWVPIGTGGRYVYVAGVGSSLPTKTDTGLETAGASAGQLRESNNGNGGIVVFDPADPRGMRIVNQIQVPAIQANTYWNTNTNSYNSPAIPGGVKLLSNVTSVTTRLKAVANASAVIGVMITDASGVYELDYPLDLDPTGPVNPGDPEPPLDVVWMLPNQAYSNIRRLANGSIIGGGNSNRPLRATFARRLDNGDVLLVNGFYGLTLDQSKQITGEVLQIDGNALDLTQPNLGYNLLSITYELPPVAGARGLVIPVFADRR